MENKQFKFQSAVLKLRKKYDEIKKTDQRFPRISGIPYRKNKKRTSIEKLMIQILNELFLDYEVEVPLIFGNLIRIFDFEIKNSNRGKIIIETDGDYWHFNKGNDKLSMNYMHLKNKKNDAMKNIIAKKHGYKVIRVWEKNLLENYDEVKQMILRECI